MGEQNFWIEDNDFYTEIVSKVADLSLNTYLLITDLQNDITYVPKTTADFLGIEEDWYHDFYRKAVAYVHPYDRPEYMQEIELRLKGEKLSDLLFIRMGKNEHYDMLGFFMDIVEKDGRSYLVIVLKNENAMPMIDPLTCLFGQTKFEMDLKEYIKNERKVAILEIELDHISDINILYGANYSDQIQQEIALRFIYMMDSETAVYRMNSTNFAFILRDVGRSEAEAFMERIKAELDGNISIGGHYFEFKIYAGGLIMDNYQGETSIVQSKLEYTLEKACERRSTEVLFFNDLVRTNSGANLDLMKVIHQSVLNQCEGFYVEYQPVVTSKDGTLVGAEALVRWKREPYGVVSPGMFIDWLENDPSMYELGNFVLETALRDGLKFLAVNPRFFVNVNVSAKQLERKSFCKVVLKLLDDVKYPADHLCLEITERCGSLPQSVIKETVLFLKKFGIKFAIDDYGTGSASSSMALNLPVDEIKIDMSFIRDIIENKKKQRMVQSIVDFANAVHVKTCIEGVADEKMEGYLRTYGASWFQGYYYSKSVSAEDLIKMIYLQ